MKFTSDFGEFLYTKLPSMYKEDDKDNDLTLERFIQTLNAGGFQTIIDKINGLEDMLNIDTVPSQYLPYIGSLFGYEYDPSLPDWFIRRLLKNIIPLYKKKGTKSCIKFLARELSGFESEIIENKDFSDSEVALTGWTKNFTNHRNFILRLKAPEETSQLQVKEDAVRLVMKDFLPTNCNMYALTLYWYAEDSTVLDNSLEELMESLITDISEVVYDSSSIIEQDYDIITIAQDVEDIVTAYNMPTSRGGENCLLNNTRFTLGTGGFILNGLTSFDIIKVDGQPDQINIL